MPKLFRKRPIVIEAVQWTGKNHREIDSFVGESVDWISVGGGVSELGVKTLEGELFAAVGDWVIKGIKGEFYPCKQDIFEKTYEEVKGESISNDKDQRP